jgi:hypothetical protein
MMVSPVYFLWAFAILGQFNTVASVLNKRNLKKKGGSKPKSEDKMKKGCNRRKGSLSPDFQAIGTEPGETTTAVAGFNFIADDGVQDIFQSLVMCTVVKKVDGVPDVGYEICTTSFTATGHTAGYFTYKLAITGGTGDYVGLFGGDILLTFDIGNDAGTWDALFCN